MMNKLPGRTVLVLACVLSFPAAAQAAPFTWFNTGPMPGLAATQDPSTAALVQAARPEIQSVASHIFCYCGCDVEHGHQSLLDCYRTGHVPVCKTCASEFVRIGQLEAQHDTLSQVQNTIDNEFSHVYPYKQPSPILRRYIAGKENNMM